MNGYGSLMEKPLNYKSWTLMEWVANDEIESSCLFESWKRPIDKIGSKVKKKPLKQFLFLYSFEISRKTTQSVLNIILKNQNLRYIFWVVNLRKLCMVIYTIDQGKIGKHC